MYLFYGRTHSSLFNAIYVPSACDNEILGIQEDHLAYYLHIRQQELLQVPVHLLVNYTIL